MGSKFCCLVAKAAKKQLNKWKDLTLLISRQLKQKLENEMVAQVAKIRQRKEIKALNSKVKELSRTNVRSRKPCLIVRDNSSTIEKRDNRKYS